MNIVIISDNKNITDAIASKLVFLRSDDRVAAINTKDIEYNHEVQSASVILVLESTSIQATVNLIKKARVNDNAVIMLVVNSYNKDLILDSCEAGADDFILTDSENIEYVIRIVKNIKYNSLKLQLERNFELLKLLNVTDIETNVYKRKYAKQVIENAIESENILSGSFMVIAPSNDYKYSSSQADLTNEIKKSIRINDIYMAGKGLQHMIFLPYTDLNGALILFNRIKSNISFDISTGISTICNKTFDEFEKSALYALSEALASKAEFIFANNNDDETLNSWLENSSEKNYKIFRKIFNRKLEKVIEPVFYRLQQTYENKITDTKIEQIVNEDACFFKLINDNNESILRIVYPGFSKILISIEHNGLDSCENEKFDLQLSDVTEKQLVNIIENFVKDYESNQ